MKMKWLSAILALILMLSMPVAFAKDDVPEVMPPTGNLDFDDAITRELTVKVDGAEMKVTQYEDVYIPEPSIDDQRVSIYVPEGATADSPIVLCVNNSGWMANGYSARTKVAKDDPENVQEYVSDSDDDKVGAILARNFVLVSYGCRSRGNQAVDGVYDGHSPATITDTKAVIRYLRLNAGKLPAGDPERIIITGTSGGGALSTVIAASGNSADYFPSLYAIGAAGVEQAEDGSYASTIDDSVYAVIAYCPITDLPNADAAYEWTYGASRAALEGIDFNTNPEKDAIINYCADAGTVNPDATEALTAMYAEYVNALNLTLDDGAALTAENLKDAIAGLMQDEIAESIEEIGIEQMRADLAAMNTGDYADWLVIEDDGSFTYDVDKHLTAVAHNNKLKVVCAFSNRGLPWSNTNEDTLFGAPDAEYAAFEAYSWDNDAVEGNGCGLDDTGLTWAEYMETEAGQALKLQMRMTNAVEYLNDDDGDKAPNWYVRYGMIDRDSSFALETILRYSIANNADITNSSFEFAWLQPHKGDYDVTEAYAWLDGVLAGE